MTSHPAWTSLPVRSTLGCFVLLDQTRFDIRPDLTILDCTLFSHVSAQQQSAVADRLIDFRNPSNSNYDVPSHNAAHASDLVWLNNQVSTAFGSDLSREACWVSPVVKAWAFGHTHFNCDFVDGDGGRDGRKRVVTNQKGYHRFPRLGFEKEKVFELG